MPDLFTDQAPAVDRMLSKGPVYQRLFVEPNQIKGDVFTRVAGYDNFGSDEDSFDKARGQLTDMVYDGTDKLNVERRTGMAQDIRKVFEFEKGRIEESTRLNKLKAVMRTGYGTVIASLGLPMLGIAPVLAVPIFVAGGSMIAKGIADYVREPGAEDKWVQRYQELRSKILYS